MLAKVIAAISRMFTGIERASRTEWEFRIRYAMSLNSWVIEINQGPGENWNALTARTAEHAGQQVTKVFDSYQAARTEAYRLGLQHAYREEFFSPRVTPLPELPRDLEAAVEAAVQALQDPVFPRMPRLRPVVVPEIDAATMTGRVITKVAAHR